MEVLFEYKLLSQQEEQTQHQQRRSRRLLGDVKPLPVLEDHMLQPNESKSWWSIGKTERDDNKRRAA